MPEYQSLEEIEKDYAKRIKASDDEDEKRSLQLEQRETTADFREVQAARRELEAHRTSVIASKNLGEWADMVTGATPEEIEASAAKIEERLSKLQTAAPAAEPSAADLYGRTGSGGGAPPVHRDETVEFIDGFQKNFNESTRGTRVQTTPAGAESPATWSVRDGEKYVRTLLGARAIEHLARNSSSPAMREAAQRIDPRTLKEKK